MYIYIYIYIYIYMQGIQGKNKNTKQIIFEIVSTTAFIN